MSEEQRKTIGETFATLAKVYVSSERGDEVTPEERDMVLRLANVATIALCDLNRIADALQTLASAPAPGFGGDLVAAPLAARGGAANGTPYGRQTPRRRHGRQRSRPDRGQPG